MPNSSSFLPLSLLSQEPALIYQDEHLLALNKPPGLLSVPGKGEAGRINLLAWAHSEWPDALVVHRLDMHTSGLMVFARNLVAQKALHKAFAERQVQKRYEAWLWGMLGEAPADHGQVNLPLICDWPNRPRQMVCHERGKAALTHWEVLNHNKPSQLTHVALKPVTGRSHQLRVHMQALGYPIVGDDLYAPPDAVAASARLMLHATHLQLPHPATGRSISLDSPARFDDAFGAALPSTHDGLLIEP